MSSARRVPTEPRGRERTSVVDVLWSLPWKTIRTSRLLEHLDALGDDRVDLCRSQIVEALVVPVGMKRAGRMVSVMKPSVPVTACANTSATGEGQRAHASTSRWKNAWALASLLVARW